MITGLRSIQRTAKADAGIILPEIPALETLYRSDFRVKFRRGQTTMVTGEPGAWKSGFMMALAIGWNLPTLYFSADLEEHTAMTRMAANLTGQSAEQVAYNLRHGGASAYGEVYEDSHLWFCYDPNPSIDTIFGEINAFVELYDEYPAVIVIDNLMDMIMDGAENEFSAQKQMILELKSLARETSSATFILHHMLQDTKPGATYYEGVPPIGRISGKASQTAGLILSLAIDGDHLKVGVIKHRYGPADKSGRTYLQYRVDPSVNRIYPLKRSVDV